MGPVAETRMRNGHALMDRTLHAFVAQGFAKRLRHDAVEGSTQGRRLQPNFNGEVRTTRSQPESTEVHESRRLVALQLKRHGWRSLRQAPV